MSRPIQAIPPELLARDDLVFLFGPDGRPQGCVRVLPSAGHSAPDLSKSARESRKGRVFQFLRHSTAGKFIISGRSLSWMKFSNSHWASLFVCSDPVKKAKLSQEPNTQRESLAISSGTARLTVVRLNVGGTRAHCCPDNHITAMGTTVFEDDDAIPEGMVWFDGDAEMRKLGLLTVLVVPVLLWAVILWIMLP